MRNYSTFWLTIVHFYVEYTIKPHTIAFYTVISFEKMDEKKHEQTHYKKQKQQQQIEQIFVVLRASDRNIADNQNCQQYTI